MTRLFNAEIYSKQSGLGELGRICLESGQGRAERQDKCPVDIFSERAGLKYGKVKSVSASLFNTDMASKTESKNPKPLCFGYKLNFQQENTQTNVRLV